MRTHYNPNGIPILGYHGLYHENKNEKAGWGWTTTSDFLSHLEYLWSKDYIPTTFKELLQDYLPASRKRWPEKKPILITFDDGYKSLYEKLIGENTFETYLKNGWFKATIFVIVSKIGNTPLNKVELDGHNLLTLNEIELMAKNKDFQFGSHSLTHPSLLSLYKQHNLEQIERELVESRTILMNHLDKVGAGFAFANVFAYPYGERHFDPEIMKHVKQAGYDCAVDFNQEPKVNNSTTNLFRLRRISMTYAEPSWNADYNTLRKLKETLFVSPVASGT